MLASGDHESIVFFFCGQQQPNRFEHLGERPRVIDEYGAERDIDELLLLRRAARVIGPLFFEVRIERLELVKQSAHLWLGLVRRDADLFSHAQADELVRLVEQVCARLQLGKDHAEAEALLGLHHELGEVGDTQAVAHVDGEHAEQARVQVRQVAERWREQAVLELVGKDARLAGEERLVEDGRRQWLLLLLEQEKRVLGPQGHLVVYDQVGPLGVDGVRQALHVALTHADHGLAYFAERDRTPAAGDERVRACSVIRSVLGAGGLDCGAHGAGAPAHDAGDVAAFEQMLHDTTQRVDVAHGGHREDEHSGGGSTGSLLSNDLLLFAHFSHRVLTFVLFCFVYGCHIYRG